MVLRAIETRLEQLFEGVFGRAFRTNVQPVELARKLAKEMDDHRSVSVSRTYVPNEYTIFLSSGDRAQFEGYENSLAAELEEYLAEHAQRESYALLTLPRVSFETDDDLGVGEFGIATRLVQPRQGPRGGQEPERQAEPPAEIVYKPRTQPVEAPPEALPPETPLQEERSVEREVGVLSWSGHRHVLDEDHTVLGRSHEADVRIEDPNVSRRHAEVVRDTGGYWLVDLGSTNGTEISGRRVQRAQLVSGSAFTVGGTTVTFTTEQE